jgi:hypothetical protein
MPRHALEPVAGIELETSLQVANLTIGAIRECAAPATPFGKRTPASPVKE